MFHVKARVRGALFFLVKQKTAYELRISDWSSDVCSSDLSSSGTLIAGALRYCRQQKTAQRVVTLVCDSGNKYLSKMFNDYWMLDQGFLERPRHGDLRDLVSRRHADRATVTVAPDDTLLVAYSRMKLYDVSQLPVIDGDNVAGIVDESDILLRVY